MHSDVSASPPSAWLSSPTAASTDVVNGEQNKIFLNVENQSDRNITITSVAGSFHHPESNKLVKNVRTLCILLCMRSRVLELWQTTALAYNVLLIEGAKIQLPYAFYSE